MSSRVVYAVAMVVCVVMSTAHGTQPITLTDAVALQEAGSEDIESPHQLLARFHRLLRIHPAEHFFPAFTIHCG